MYNETHVVFSTHHRLVCVNFSFSFRMVLNKHKLSAVRRRIAVAAGETKCIMIKKCIMRKKSFAVRHHSAVAAGGRRGPGPQQPLAGDNTKRAASVRVGSNARPEKM